MNEQIKTINNELIFNVLQHYIYTHKPVILESFNNGYPTEDTYILEITNIIRPKIVDVLHNLKYNNHIYLSNEDKYIYGLPYKSYAFYKEIISENNKTIFVFCLENDKECKGILLS